MDEQPVMQRDNELSRTVAAGKRSDNGEKCSLVLVQNKNKHWTLYPHGDDRLGVRLPDQEAQRVARTILDGTR